MNIEKSIEIGINNYEEYKKLENEYKKFFEYYLLSKVDLSKYNEEIKNSKLGFGDITSKVNLKSNLYEYMKLNHIFVLNEFYIEKLDSNGIQILKNGKEEDKENLIIKTYKEIIKSNYNRGKYSSEIYKINYLLYDSNKGYFDNDSLVLAIYYGRNKEKYNSKEKYINNYLKKKEFMDKLINKLKKEI